jgi:hypothetical protein
VLHAILCLLPALVLAAVLLARRYPGERLLIALAPKRRRRWPRPHSSADPRRRVLLTAVHGGLLIVLAVAS